MNIKHYPITNTNQVEQIYSEQDKVPVKYVCSTEFIDGIIADIFYRETPHPVFGNRYFAILFRDDKPYIANADRVEGMSFGMVMNDQGAWEYSRSRHDYKSFKNGNMIDGGRDYIKSSGKVKVFFIRDGAMISFGVSNK